MESWEIILIVVGSVVSLFLLYILLAMIFKLGPYRTSINEDFEDVQFDEKDYKDYVKKSKKL